MREAATIKGALRHGEVIDLDQVPELDLVLTGSVAVNLKGARMGKGGGFSDLEYGLLLESGKIDRRTVVATTVHPIQILRENLLMTGHDIPVNLVATSRAVIEVDGAYKRPAGILWDHLQPPQIHEIPVLERFGYAGLSASGRSGQPQALRASLTGAPGRPVVARRSRRPRPSAASFHGWISVAASDAVLAGAA